VEEKLEELTQAFIIFLIEFHPHYLENGCEEDYPKNKEHHEWLQIDD